LMTWLYIAVEKEMIFVRTKVETVMEEGPRPWAGLTNLGLGLKL
jgi:hypothetical protein